MHTNNKVNPFVTNRNIDCKHAKMGPKSVPPYIQHKCTHNTLEEVVRGKIPLYQLTKD